MPTGTSTMAPVRLTVSPSLMVLSLPKITHADIVGFQVQRHALDAAGKLDHLAGLDIVEAIDAGDAVADAQHFADFADLRFGAEILDFALQDGGDFGGLDIHVLVSSSWPHAGRPAWCECEESIMREPTLTTRPPSRVGSTLV